MQKYLKPLRVTLAVAVLISFLLYFTVAKTESHFFHALTHLQFIPALMCIGSLMVPIIILIVITLLFGRIYCSILCPSGILQDVIAWTAKRFKKRKKRNRYHYTKPKSWIRYGLLIITCLSWWLGFNAVVTFLDPYGIFGRIAQNNLHPLLMGINNLLVPVFPDFIYPTSFKSITMAAAIIAGLHLLLFTLLAAFRGRWYCNVICPVGTLLGLISKVSLFKIKINTDLCNGCKACLKHCKSECIDTKNHTIDYSRCVMCFDCFPACSQNAITVQKFYTPKQPSAATATPTRRKFLGTTLSLAALFTSSKLLAGTTSEPTGHNVPPIMPPGAGSLSRFQSRCTGCHLCISKCPSQTLKPAFLEYGLSGIMQPVMDYAIGYCGYNCTLCTEICPTHALQTVKKEDKHRLQIGQVRFDIDKCVVNTDGTDCGACSEHCPTQAVTMVDFKDDLRIPHINVEKCLGCGGCQYICPVRPQTAIYVAGVEEHQLLRIEQEYSDEKVEVTDFGF